MVLNDARGISLCNTFASMRPKTGSKLVQVFCRYKLRSAVDIADVSDEYSVWARFGSESDDTGLLPHPTTKCCRHCSLFAATLLSVPYSVLDLHRLHLTDSLATKIAAFEQHSPDFSNYS